MSRLSELFLINGWPKVPFPLRLTLRSMLIEQAIQVDYCTVNWDHSPGELTVMGLRKSETGTFGFVTLHIDKFALQTHASLYHSARVEPEPALTGGETPAD